MAFVEFACSLRHASGGERNSSCPAGVGAQTFISSEVNGVYQEV